MPLRAEKFRYTPAALRAALITVLAINILGKPLAAQNADLVPFQTLGGSAFGLYCLPTSGGSGASVNCAGWLVKNTGTSDAGPFSVAVYLSSDTTVGPTAHRIGTTTVSGLAAGTTMAVPPFPSISATIPGMPAGTYNILLRVDDGNAVTETDETNNVLVSLTHFRVLPALNADLRVYAGPVLSAGNPNEPVPVGEGPAAVAREGMLYVTILGIRNAGDEAIPETKATFYLSPDATITSADIPLDSITVPRIEPRSNVVAAVPPLKLPATDSRRNDILPGNYFFGVILDSDNQVIERGSRNAEANNTAAVPLRILPGPSDATSVRRIQIVLKTAFVKDANTDDDMLVQLNPDHWTWMDYGRDDFEKGDSFPYDMVLRDVSSLGDIQEIRMTKWGDDGWCGSGIEVRVNNVSVFSKDFSPCRWLDNPSSPVLLITYADLRNSPAWQNYQPPPLESLLTLSHVDLTRIIEAAVGDAIHATPIAWGHLHGDAVELSKSSDHEIDVDLDLAATTEFPFPNHPEVDVDFPISVGCECGQVKLTVGEPTVDLDRDLLQELLSGGAFEGLHQLMQWGLSNTLSHLLLGTSYGPDVNSSYCPKSITVLSNADIALDPLPGGLELSVTSTAVPSAMFRRGDVVTINSTVRNNGRTDSGSINEDVFFSPVYRRAVRTPGLRVGGSERSAVPMCNTTTWTDTYRLPTMLQCSVPRPSATALMFDPTIIRYEMTVQMNVADSNSGDNRSVVPIDISDVDLAAPDRPPISGQYVVRSGHSISLSGSSFSNRGAFSSGPVTYGFALFRLDQTVTVPVTRGNTGWPVILSSVQVPSLRAGESRFWGSTPVVIPPAVPGGHYKLVAFIQDEHNDSECSLANNTQSFDITVVSQ